jgi:hypothetical protein
MGDALFEAIKTIGGISGICTAIFLVYDRFTKHYPVAFIEGRPLMEGSKNIVPFLFLKNVSERPILLSWTDGNACQIRIARNQSSREIMRTLFDGETTIALSPQAEATLPLFKPQPYDDIDSENMLELAISWQFAQPIWWRSPRTLWVRIRKRDFDALIEGHVDPDANA